MTRHNPAEDGPLQLGGESVLLYLLALPKSGRNEIAGVRNGRLLVKVTAPPEDGQANAAICRLLSHALDLPLKAIEVKHGASSRHKTFQLSDISIGAAKAALNL